MSARVDGRARVRGLAGDGLSARCESCGLSLELQQNADVAAALASFDVHHPDGDDTGHSPGLPWGWSAAG